MKQVIQLDEDGYFVGTAVAEESPLEKDVYHYPANTIDGEIPVVPDGYKAKWNGSWEFEKIPDPDPEPTEWELVGMSEQDWIASEYKRNRLMNYPSIGDQLDMQYWDSVNGTTTWADAIAAVKTEHPKP